MITTTNLNQARKEIQEYKKQNRLVIVKAQTPEFNRKIIENKDVDIITDLELHNRKDNLKQRDSGLNEVLCKLATKNNIKIGINLNEIIKLSKKEKTIVIARIIQNITLCKRTKTKIIILNKEKYNKQELFSLLLTLGMHNKDIKQIFSKNNQIFKIYTKPPNYLYMFLDWHKNNRNFKTEVKMEKITDEDDIRDKTNPHNIKNK